MKNLQSFGEIFAQWEEKCAKKPKKKPFDPNKAMLKWLDSNKIVKKDEIVESPPKKIDWKSEKIEAKIDLHGLTWGEAEGEIAAFIDRAKRGGKRKILIVHGKGIHSKDGQSVLRENVRKFLERDPQVGEFRECDAKEGGSGATWAVLR